MRRGCIIVRAGGEYAEFTDDPKPDMRWICRKKSGVVYHGTAPDAISWDDHRMGMVTARRSGDVYVISSGCAWDGDVVARIVAET